VREVPIIIYRTKHLPGPMVAKHVRENPTLDLDFRQMTRGRISVVGTPKIVLPIKV
jgi:hypothetical protein